MIRAEKNKEKKLVETETGGDPIDIIQEADCLLKTVVEGAIRSGSESDREYVTLLFMAEAMLQRHADAVLNELKQAAKDLRGKGDRVLSTATEQMLFYVDGLQKGRITFKQAAHGIAKMKMKRLKKQARKNARAEERKAAKRETDYGTDAAEEEMIRRLREDADEGPAEEK